MAEIKTFCMQKTRYCIYANGTGHCMLTACNQHDNQSAVDRYKANPPEVKPTTAHKTEPTITHDGIEVERELKKIEACLFELDQIVAWGDEKFDDDSCEYIENLLKSRRDALISQRVIR